MRIASFILPVTHSRGSRFDAAHQTVRHDLLNAFGGFTESDVRGSWLSPTGKVCHDTGVRYDVAAQWTREESRRFLEIVMQCGAKAHQESMFLIRPSGKADIVATAPAIAAPVPALESAS